MSTTHGAALVSGASRGLGAMIARRLAADGWPVAVNYRSGLERTRPATSSRTSSPAAGQPRRSPPTSPTRPRWLAW